jgi:hypothetical protein
LLLRRFSLQPRSKNPALWKLNVASGNTFQSNVGKETVIDHYYRIEDKAVPLSPGFADELLQRIENDAAGPIQKLVEGVPLSLAERESVAHFIQVQRQRTPTARAWNAFLDAQMQTELAKAKLSDPQLVKSFFTLEGADDPKGDDEIERWRLETLAALDKGEIGFESGQTREVGLVFFAFEISVHHILNAMRWRLIRAPSGTGFICSDNPLNLYDPQAKNRAYMHAGVGWASPALEATLPLDPKVCLLLKQRPRGLARLIAIWRPNQPFDEVDAKRVGEINLRTYASAQEFIYGPTQDSVLQVHRNATLDPTLVEEFRAHPPQLTIIENHKGGVKRATTHRPPRRPPNPRRRK